MQIYSTFRKCIKLLVWFMLIMTISSVTVSQEVPQYVETTELGRGPIGGVSWSPERDLLAVNTTTGIWLYTADLEVMARLIPPSEQAYADISSYSSVALRVDGEKLLLRSRGYLWI